MTNPPRDGREIIARLAATNTSDLYALRKEFFSGEAVPTLDELRTAWMLLAQLRAVLESGNEKHWKHLQKVFRAASDPLPFGSNSVPPPATESSPPSHVPRGNTLAFAATDPTAATEHEPLPFEDLSDEDTLALDAEPQRPEPSPFLPAPPLPVQPAPYVAPLPSATPVDTPQTTGLSTVAFEMSTQEYALLCATRDAHPDRLGPTLERYSLVDEGALEALDRYWDKRFKGDVALQQECEALKGEFADWLSSQA